MKVDADEEVGEPCEIKESRRYSAFNPTVCGTFEIKHAH